MTRFILKIVQVTRFLIHVLEFRGERTIFFVEFCKLCKVLNVFIAIFIIFGAIFSKKIPFWCPKSTFLPQFIRKSAHISLICWISVLITIFLVSICILITIKIYFSLIQEVYSRIRRQNITYSST